MISVGSRLIGGLRIGEKSVDSVYRGSNQIFKQYGGIPVYFDKAVVLNANGYFNEIDTVGITSWFITLIDMGEATTRRVEFGYEGSADVAIVNMRLFDDLSQKSVDFWTITPTIKTVNFVKSRYALATIRIQYAGKFYMKDVNSGKYLVKGIDVGKEKHVVHFRQRVEPVTAYAQGGVVTRTQGTSLYKIKGTTTGNFTNVNYVENKNSLGVVAGHEYLGIVNVVRNTLRMPSGRFYMSSTLGVADGGINGTGIRVCTEAMAASGTSHARLEFNTGYEYDADVYLMFFDLTEMFADCPELKPNSVEEFRKMFPEDYYEYTAEPYDVYI